ncbi:MAG: hypothetical protein Q8K60_05780 [Parachlamydiaceae bacterium]|nr:hypothetical protein [Parachlamydiaceae bacterium]
MKKLHISLTLVLFIPTIILSQWSEITTPFLNYEEQVGFLNFQATEGNFFGVTAYNDIFKSSNMGLNWSKIDLPPLQNIHSFFSTGKTLFLLVSESNDYRFYRSTNNGINWEVIDHSFLSYTPNTTPVIGNINSCSNTSSGLLLATTTGIYRSSNEGITWINSGKGLPPPIDLSLIQLEEYLF